MMKPNGSDIIIAAPFLILWALAVIGNAAAAYRTHVRKKFVSAVPLVGAVFGVIGLWQLPPTRAWCWLAVVLDYGTLEFLWCLPKIARELWQTSRFNLQHELVATPESRLTLRLFKQGIYVLGQRWQRPPGEAGLIAASDTGTWRMEDGRLLLTSWQNHRIKLAPGPTGWQVTHDDRPAGSTGLRGVVFTSTGRFPLAKVIET